MSVDIIFKIAAIGILITVITQILKKSDRDDIATLVSIAGLIIVLSFVINMISDLFDNIKNIFYLYWYDKNRCNCDNMFNYYCIPKKRKFRISANSYCCIWNDTVIFYFAVR